MMPGPPRKVVAYSWLRPRTEATDRASRMRVTGSHEFAGGLYAAVSR